MPIYVFADPICPWCYIGKRRLEAALAQWTQAPAARPARRAAAIAVRWRPYLLNPAMPAGGMDRAAYLMEKFGASGRATRVSDGIVKAGRDVGLAFALDRIRRTPATIDCHRAIAFATTRGDAAAFIERLFAAYLCEGRDIGERDELLSIATEAGLPIDELRRYLASDAGYDAVRDSRLSARALGIHAVPCFVLDGRYAVTGAQPPEVFLRLFDLLRDGAPIAAAAE